MSFRHIPPERIKEIAQSGGRAAWEKGKAHKWTHEEAVAAGKASQVGRRKRRLEAAQLAEESKK